MHNIVIHVLVEMPTVDQIGNGQDSSPLSTPAGFRSARGFSAIDEVPIPKILNGNVVVLDLRGLQESKGHGVRGVSFGRMHPRNPHIASPQLHTE
jgi:hypothetical protein